MTKKPIISIIIPTHKRSNLLKRAITSIRKNDINKIVEIIVISDCIDASSTQICDQILLPQDIFIRRNGKPGPSLSRNFGLTLANGKIILFLDDDDDIRPGLIEFLATNPNLEAGTPIYFNCTVIEESRLPTHVEKKSEYAVDLSQVSLADLYIKNQIPNSCFAFPAQCIHQLKFDEHLRAYEDWEFNLSVLDRYIPIHEAYNGVNIYQVNDETTDRRGNSKVANDFNAVLDYIYIYHRHPASDSRIKETRSQLLRSVGLMIDPQFI